MEILVILSWILCGLIVGLIARWLVSSAVPLGIVRTILVGIAGAFLGGLISRVVLGAALPVSFSVAALPGWLFAILGAVLVLVLYTWWERKRTRTDWW